MTLIPSPEQLACPSGCAQVFLKLTGRDVLSHVDEFMTSTAQWPDTTICPDCFSVLSSHVDSDCGPSCRTFNTIQVHRHAFWIQSVRLIIELTTTNIPRLRHRLLVNQQKCSAELHGVALACSFADPVDMLLHGLYAIVSGGLTRGLRPLQPRGESFKYFHKRHGHWPISIEQLFPLGAARCVDALVFWCCVPVGPAQFSLLTTILTVARALVIGRLLESPTRDRLVWAIARMLTPSALQWPTAAPFIPPSGLTLPERLRGNPHVISAILTFLTLLRDDFNARSDETTHFVAGYAPPLLAALTSVVARFGTDPRAAIAHEYITLLRGGGGSADAPDAVATIHEYLLRRSSSRLCASTACAVSELTEGAVRPFQQCGNCRFVRYCGRECQRRDWNAGAGGRHKDICPILCKLLGAVDPFLEGLEFRRAFEELGLEAADVDSLHRWALAGGLLPPRA
ncbi:hypothetical protein AURDEDRAFT_173771 [Auricularia subglabra TFB-10046 SS5]|nr:hypothetical protein AURDEDRAFT_173771 [Auricularia subglabra TFB-10046 SS5]